MCERVAVQMYHSYARLNFSRIISVLSLLRFASCASLSDWRSRSIYQIVTDRFAFENVTQHSPCAVVEGLYCGGTWQGIKAKLDYIEGMNFDAIWISPIVANVPQRTADGEAYTGYWQQNLYELNSNFGSADDLRELVKAVHDRGMYLMLDIVVNHMGFAGLSQLVDYNVFYPFNDRKYFHDYCRITDPNDPLNVEKCWLGDLFVPLVDIRTEDSDVRKMYGDWISGIVSNYSIDGLRIDTSINVEPSFFPDFIESAGIFATGEVLQGDDSQACKWEDSIGSILNYPIYFTLTRAFQSEQGSIDDLVRTIDSVKQNCNDPTAMGSFSENHDQPRFASYTEDMSLAENIITYTILADGIPIIYQGQEQHMNGDVTPYTNRAPLWSTGYDTSARLYTHIATLNKFRQHVVKASKNYTLYMNEAIFQDYHSLAMRKGFGGSQVITVLSNNGQSSDDYILEVPNHGFQAGVQLTEILGCTNLTVNGTGYIKLPMSHGKPNVMYPTNLLYNSSLCGMPDRPPDVSSSTIPTTITTSMNGHLTTVETHTVSEVPVATTNGYVSVTSIAASSPARTTGTQPSRTASASCKTHCPSGAASSNSKSWKEQNLVILVLATLSFGFL